MASLTDLPDVFYSAHRGGAGEAPENTLEALRAGGRWAEVLDLDTQVLGDGTPVLLHDTTVDRTTNGTGPVSGYNAAQWEMVRCDPAAWYAPGYPQLAAPTLEQALDTLGGRRILTAEAKTSDGVPALAALIRDRGLADSVLINTNDPTLVPAIRAEGCRAHLWRSAAQMASDDFTGFVTDGADVLDVDISASDDLITQAVAAAPALGVWAHTLTRRTQRDRALSLGVRGLVTDYPAYLTGRAPSRTADSLTAGWGYGYVPTTTRPKLLTGGILHFTATTDTQVLLLGELSPLTASTFTVETTFSFSAATGRPWFALHLGTDDASVTLKSSQIAHDGYTCQFTGGGNLTIYRDDLTTGTSTNIASAPIGAAVTADTPYTLRVTVTPTQLRLSVPELSSVVLTVNDAKYRGPMYLYLGRAASSAGVTAKAWDITTS